MTAEELLRRLLSCVFAEAGGLAGVRERRRWLAEFWFAGQVHRYHNETEPLAPDWHVEVVWLFAAYTEAYGRFIEGAETTGVECVASWCVAGSVRETVLAVNEAMTGYDEASCGPGPSDRRRAAARMALTRLFDWDNNNRLRAYVFVMTGEALADGQMRTEKSRLLDALDRCRDQLRTDIERLLG